MRKIPVLLAAILASTGATAAAPEDLMSGYAQQARGDAAPYSGPSVAAGRHLFNTRHRDWSCASCHTANPGATGRHVVTGKPIAPLAPAFNPERLRDPSRVEKWFRRNCNDTLGRSCTAAEKADVIAYLLSLRQGA